ncbi:uncharacterized protein [Anabrus simplex]|uniref:uncharacterized protein n=1 Tax=Anabrus simplex TaxID=316456 RepID=UPI0035A3CFAF
MHLLLVIAITAKIFYQTTGVSSQECNATTTFIKIAERVPPQSNQILLYSRPGSAVTIECGQRCRASRDCPAFLVNYENSSCFRVISTQMTQYVGPVRPIDVVTSTNYFERSCLKVPANCTSKLWALERADGFEMITAFRAIFSNISSGEQCGQLCLVERQFICRSARYNSRTGQCKLSAEDRRTQPDSYRGTETSIQYWENQCAASAFPGKSCSLEEYPNSTMCCADRLLEGLTQEKCLSRCEQESNFTCRGSTFIPSGASGQPTMCVLHGDDTSSVGPRAIQSLQGATYWEKVPCLNLLVTCSSDLMKVTVHTDTAFNGRIYVRGKSEQCNSPGRGGRDTDLKIPLRSTQGRVDNKCGVMIVRSIGDQNRTLISAVVIVQYNAIIQRRGDRAVKVACMLDDSSPKNVTVGASLSFAGPDGFINGGTAVVNASAIPPTVSLQILDRSSGNREAREAQLGQDLELRINVEPQNSSYDIRVVHLIATSQDNTQSFLLIDGRGCPPDEKTFPALRRISPDSKSLVANFRAFKFPRSNVVKFNATVHFCPGSCEPVNCESGLISYGKRRRKREAMVTDNMFQELPLQFALIVHSPDIVSDAVLAPALNNSEIITAGVWPGTDDADLVCMQWSTLLGVALAWVLLQFVILIACYVATHWRRRLTSPQDEHKLQDDFPGYDSSRHVHWADEDK